MVDNYDSFTYNLVHLLEELGAEVFVRQSDTISPGEAEALAPDRLVISPGPGRPADAGRSIELILALAPTTPTLGVCLGHQAIVEAYGGEIGQVEKYRGTSGKMALAEKVRIEIGGANHFVQPTIDAILSSARTGEVGDGKIMVMPIEKIYRIRTGESDQDAVTPVPPIE